MESPQDLVQMCMAAVDAGVVGPTSLVGVTLSASPLPCAHVMTSSQHREHLRLESENILGKCILLKRCINVKSFGPK